MGGAGGVDRLAGVAEGLQVTPAVTVPAEELRWRFSSSGGPGGQYVNTADTRVELSFDLAATTALPAPLKYRALTRLAPQLPDGATAAPASQPRSRRR